MINDNMLIDISEEPGEDRRSMDERIKDILDKSESIVFFGGAGVSTESGIPDFRSESGLYNAIQNYGYSPEEMLSRDFYYERPELFFKYYKENLIHRGAEPNPAHITLAKLEDEGKLTGVITQNIDGLHQKAGCKKVYELHGSVMRNYCEKCGAYFDLDYIMNDDNCKNSVPYCNCDACNGRVKPDVVLYGEALNDNVVEEAVAAISAADTMIIGGTSLVVYPAAGLIHYFRGENLILINKTPTQADNMATLAIHDSIGKVLSL